MGITDGNCGYKPSFFRTHIFLPQSRRICLTHLSWILGVMPPWVRSPMPFRPPPPSLILSLYSVVPRRVRHPSFSTPTSCASLQTSRVVGSTFTLRLAVVFGPPLLPYPNPSFRQIPRVASSPPLIPLFFSGEEHFWPDGC